MMRTTLTVTTRAARERQDIGRTSPALDEAGATSSAPRAASCGSAIDAYEPCRAGSPTRSASAAEVARELAAVAEGLTYMSETDAPYEPFSARLPSAVALDVARFAKAAGIPARVEVSELDLARFFASQQDPTRGLDLETRTGHARLERAMRERLTDLRMFMAGGEEQVEGYVYLVGRTCSGDLAGLRALRIWT